MKNFDVKEHTRKHIEFAKKVGDGTFPNKKATKIGSVVGLGLGCILFLVGIYGLMQSAAFGIGSMIAGCVAAISNVINIKRINSK